MVVIGGWEFLMSEVALKGYLPRYPGVQLCTRDCASNGKTKPIALILRPIARSTFTEFSMFDFSLPLSGGSCLKLYTCQLKTPLSVDREQLCTRGCSSKTKTWAFDLILRSKTRFTCPEFPRRESSLPLSGGSRLKRSTCHLK